MIDMNDTKTDRLAEIAHRLAETGPTVDLVVELAGMLPTGAESDEVRTRLADLYDIETYDGYPDGAVIVRLPSLKYMTVLDGREADEQHDTYGDALDRLRIDVENAIASEPAGSTADVPVSYVNLRTGLRLDLPALPDIREDWHRPEDPEIVWPAGLHIVEAFCALCGETCNPHGPDDMTHVARLQSDEHPCGGPLVLTGWGY